MKARLEGRAMSSDTREVDYKTHILIGRTSAGDMAVIGEWPHVPRQSEVQQKIDGARQRYAVYLLCTPTSIMPASGNVNGGGQGLGSSSFR
jgi:hypothetical protein